METKIVLILLFAMSAISTAMAQRGGCDVSGAANLVCYGNPREVNERVDRSSSLKFR